MRKAWPVMGTVVSLEIPGAKAEVFEDVAAFFEGVDKKFSPYKKNSEVARYARGAQSQASKELAGIIKECQRYQKKTDGFFSADYNGNFDPSGYVKAWAIAKAGKLIEKSGYKTYCLGVGGDILAKSQATKTWTIGISDPENTKKVIVTLEIKNGAVATSGNYERGQHIYNPKSGKPADFWQSVTIINSDIIEADVWATAAFAMEHKAPARLAKQSISYVLIDKAGHIIVSDSAKAYSDYS